MPAVFYGLERQTKVALRTMLSRWVKKNAFFVTQLIINFILIKVSANPKLTILHNFGFLYDSISLRNSFRLKKNPQKNVIRTGSYLAKTIILPSYLY